MKLYKTVDSEEYSEVYNPPAIGLPFKMRIGDTFETSSTVTEYDPDGNIIGTNDIYTHMTLLAEEDITVKAGSFTKCLKLLKKENDEGKWSMAFVWLAHGIGEVKRDILGSEVRELISLTMPGKTFVPVD